MKEHETKKNKRPDTVFRVEAETTLLPFLLGRLEGMSRNNVKSLLTHRQVIVNEDTVTRHDTLLHAGYEVRIHWGLVRNPKQTRSLLRIIYEDDDIIVAEKPAGMLTIATEKEKEKTAYHILTDYVREQDAENRIFIVHRLDRDTSGILMFARSERVKRILQDNWKDYVEDRAYLALVEGTVTKKSGRVHSWLNESPTHMMYSGGENSGGQEAITHYRCLETGNGYSLMEIRLETGRKNQIRVHMQDLGHSIAGDKRYGAATNPLGRLALHAYLLRFKHPVTGEMMSFETEVPAGFSRRLHGIRKNDAAPTKKDYIKHTHAEGRMSREKKTNTGMKERKKTWNKPSETGKRPVKDSSGAKEHAAHRRSGR